MKPRAAVLISILYGGAIMNASGTSYYLDAQAGRDANSGTTPETAWATLKQASSSFGYKPGDRILLRRGSRFTGKLSLDGLQGTKNAPVIVDAYGDGGDLPLINSAGYIAGVSLQGCERVLVQNLEIVSDGGKAVDEKAKTDRYGVYIDDSLHVTVEDLNIHSIFATIQTKSEGKDGTTAYGHGVRIEDSEHIRVVGCEIERVGRYGINALRSSNLDVVNNRTDDTGCSGVQMSRCKAAAVRNNTFDHPGSFVDERMHGRGSGSWVWGCDDVLYERNRFLNARGKADSAGVHIDFNCSNVVIQYCFSMNNEGGFIEILGNNHNCAYRYNISVNDGGRTKGKHGAHQQGKTFWLSGYCGRKNPRSGPFNSYIYNNTIFVKEGAPARFSITPTARGALVANNIFHIMGETSVVGGDQKKYKRTKSKATGIVFTNNVYVKDDILPADLGVSEISPVIGDAGFKNAGGSLPEDYIPSNAKLLRNKGIPVERLPSDSVGLVIGLEVNGDFFGNPIRGKPDIGAVELSD